MTIGHVYKEGEFTSDFPSLDFNIVNEWKKNDSK